MSGSATKSSAEPACYGSLFWKVNNITLLDCKPCGFIHQHPIPSMEEYYNEDKFYAEHASPDHFSKVEREHLSGYWDTAYGYQSSLMTDSTAVLDVGCGAGWFMKYWKEHHQGNPYAVIGIEPSETARSLAHESIKEFIYPSLFDLRVMHLHNWNVRMSLVLEHIPDPLSFLTAYLPMTGASGSLVIIVPNEFSPLQSRIGTYHFMSSVHVNYFTPQSLKELVCRSYRELGYKGPVKVSLRGTFPMEVFQLMGIHYIGNDSLGRKCHRFRLKFEKALGLLSYKLYARLMNKYNWGREIILVAKAV